MNRELNRLIKDVGPDNEDIYNKLVSIAHKVARQKDYLLIDVLDMESMVDESKVTPVPPMDRVEVEV
jgi:hypothetical protein